MTHEFLGRFTNLCLDDISTTPIEISYGKILQAVKQEDFSTVLLELEYMIQIDCQENLSHFGCFKFMVNLLTLLPIPATGPVLKVYLPVLEYLSSFISLKNTRPILKSNKIDVLIEKLEFFIFKLDPSPSDFSLLKSSLQVLRSLLHVAGREKELSIINKCFSLFLARGDSLSLLHIFTTLDLPPTIEILILGITSFILKTFSKFITISQRSKPPLKQPLSFIPICTTFKSFLEDLFIFYVNILNTQMKSTDVFKRLVDPSPYVCVLNIFIEHFSLFRSLFVVNTTALETIIKAALKIISSIHSSKINPEACQHLPIVPNSLSPFFTPSTLLCKVFRFLKTEFPRSQLLLFASYARDYIVLSGEWFSRGRQCIQSFSKKDIEFNSINEAFYLIELVYYEHDDIDQFNMLNIIDRYLYACLSTLTADPAQAISTGCDSCSLINLLTTVMKSEHLHKVYFCQKFVSKEPLFQYILNSIRYFPSSDTINLCRIQVFDKYYDRLFSIVLLLKEYFVRCRELSEDIDRSLCTAYLELVSEYISLWDDFNFSALFLETISILMMIESFQYSISHLYLKFIMTHLICFYSTPSLVEIGVQALWYLSDSISHLVTITTLNPGTHSESSSNCDMFTLYDPEFLDELFQFLFTSFSVLPSARPYSIRSLGLLLSYLPVDALTAFVEISVLHSLRILYESLLSIDHKCQWNAAYALLGLLNNTTLVKTITKNEYSKFFKVGDPFNLIYHQLITLVFNCQNLKVRLASLKTLDFILQRYIYTDNSLKIQFNDSLLIEKMKSIAVSLSEEPSAQYAKMRFIRELNVFLSEHLL